MPVRGLAPGRSSVDVPPTLGAFASGCQRWLATLRRVSAERSIGSGRRHVAVAVARGRTGVRVGVPGMPIRYVTRHAPNLRNWPICQV